VGCTAQIEIRTGIDLKHTKLAMDRNLQAEITETKPVVDSVPTRQRLISGKDKIKRDDLS
jgi:hypothetical protein